ncbi:MAG: phage portal protein [Planctomycetia bacterium]|nr:phage portal protein [Planctomycetia bacterium]
MLENHECVEKTSCNNIYNEDKLYQLLEHYISQYVNSDEMLYDSPGQWLPMQNDTTMSSNTKLFSEMFFEQIRNESRNLYFHNPYAINAIENRISFVIGKGHKYHVIPNNEQSVNLAKITQEIIDDFLDKNHWLKRQKEIMRRKDRDGEVFLRYFVNGNGETTIRFVEPEHVKTPNNVHLNYTTDLGINTKKNDVETILGYWINNEYVDAKKIQHRKSFVDSTVKRGIPILYAVRKNLIRVDKLLRNMSIVAEIQSAIALIRKHSDATAENIQRFLAQKQNKMGHSNGFNVHEIFQPGTIIDAQAGIDYQFPIAAIDASRYIQILQAELRAIAARLVMPEFMLTSDASNANYSSTMIAEGPAVRMFERIQEDMIHDDIDLLQEVVKNAAITNRLPKDVLKCVKIQAVPPTLAVRDRYKETKADEILLKHGIISPQTMALRYGLNPEKESWLHCHCKTEDKCDCNSEK